MKNLFRKSLLVLIGVLITSLTTQVWAYDLTFRCIPKQIWGNNWTEGSSKVKINAQDENGTWRYIVMTDEGNTYNGYKIYKGKLTDFSSDKAHNIQFQRLNSSSQWQEQLEWGDYKDGSFICSQIRTSSGWTAYKIDHSIAASSTVIWDMAGNDKSWAASYLYRDVNGSSGGNDEMTRIGTTTQWYKTYASASTKIASFQFRANNSNWNDYTHTTNIEKNVSGVTLYTYDNTNNGGSPKKLNWHETTNAKKATSGTKIYLDKTNATGWGEVWLKYGTQWFNRSSAVAATLVTGTDALYVITMPNDAYYEKYVLADNYGYTNYNNITNDGNLKHRIAHQASNLSSDITYIPTSTASGKGTSGNPYVWNCSTLSGHTRTLTISAPSNGSISATYTDEGGVERTVTSGSFSVAQTCKVTITATPSDGYALSALTLGGNSITSGAEQIIRADGTIAATFVAETTYNITVSHKIGSRTLHDAEVVSVGITTPRNISSQTIDGFSFSSWSNLTNVTNHSANLTTDPISVTSTAVGSMTCNYTQWPCSLDINTTSGNTGYTSRVAMTYDATAKAYYKEFTTTAATQYFRFYINSKKYAPSSNTEVVISGTKVAAATDVTDYASSMPSVYFDDGGTGSTIIVWFDYENRKAWVQEKKYTVTVSAGSHGSVSPTSVSVGNVVASGTITATADDHYHWSSWDVPSGVTIASGSGTRSITIKATAASKTVTANFAGDQYTITYKDQGNKTFTGTQTSAPTTHTYGTATTLKIPTKIGYDFGGWFTASDCASGAVGNTTSASLGATAFTANITLYAKWTAKNYTASNNLKNSSSTAIGQYNVTYDNTSIAYTSAPSKTGYQEDGFYKENTLTNKIANADKSLVSSTTTYTSGGKWKYTSAPDLFVKWAAKTYAVTLNMNGSYTSDGSATAQYDRATLSSITAPTRTGYHVEGYYTNDATPVYISDASGNLQANKTGYTGAGGIWTKDGTATLYAHWTANTYTITLDKGTGGTANGTATVVYDTDALATKTHATKTGHSLTGYYTNASSGTKVLNANGSFAGSNIDGYITDGVWTKAANCTLYAQWTPNNYTVTFDATTNGGSCATKSKSVTFGSAYGELPVATHAANTFIGWYTTASGEGTHVTSSTTVSTASDHILYARFESTYTVNVQFKCGSVTLYPGTTVQASPTSLAADISAPEILGYRFVNWTGSNATFGNPSSATTTVNASAATTITANYNAVPTVYFKNNLGWENVYVSFNIDFVTAAGATVPKNNGKPYYKMTQLGTSDIFYCEIPSTYTANDYAGWKGNIAFDNKGFGDYSSTHTGNSNSFYRGEFLGRADFDPNATLYIPYKGDKETRNSGKYYPTGCWIQYNSNYSGYKVKVNTKVQGTGGTETVAELRTTIAGSTEFKGTVNLTSANYTYGVMLYKEYLKNSNDLWYTNVNNEANTITSATTSLPWAFQPCTDSWQRCRVKTEALGDYEITVSFATGKPMVNITYPVSVGDWRLVYKDRAIWSNGAHSASWWHPSRVIKAKANAVDTVSFFVAYGSTPSVELQKCTAIDGGTGAQTWTKQGDYLSLSSITKKGVYNFKVTQTGSKVASAAYLGEYSGDFYIRTDASDGGWNNYMNGANTMTYSEYSIEHGGYTHYFMNYRHSGTSVKFVIANDYSPCISDTILGDTYTGNSEWLPAAANIRFMWDKRSNTISRAYLSGSTIVSDRFLVLEGDAKMFDENGNPLSISGLSANEMKFTDDQNWIYEATVKAQPTARIKLTAKYNNKIQYFYGKSGARSESTTELLIGGSGTDKYKVRVVYDFKTNRLIKAFIPEGTISTAMAINADLMIIREAQGDAQQINFSGDGTLSKVQTVYGAMKFNKWNVNDKDKGSGHANLGWSRYKRDLFYISFPFDVKLSDAFGFGEYGKHWIIEYYDGKGRAANGFWADSDPNWKFVWPSQRSSFTLKAFEGYILALELDEMTESSEVWEHGVEDVYVYFPSADSVKNISATTRTITIDQEGYYCSINRPTPDGDRRVKDSYWHVIGVPSFANYSSTLYDTNGGTAIDWTSTSMPYLYEWNSSDNTLSITTSANFAFKPTYSYMVQYAGASIYWNAVNVTPAAAPRRNPAYRGEYEFRLEMLQNDEKVDQTYVKLSDDENVTTGFEFNYDLSKEFNKKKANIYTLIGTEQVAGNVLPLTEQTTIVPIGVKTVASGDYTFAMPDGTEGIGVTLIDNETGLRTPLGLTDYTVTLEAGTYDERFALEISPVKQTPTDIELLNGENGENGVRKVMIDGILYIVKDGKVFDARGSRVK